MSAASRSRSSGFNFLLSSMPSMSSPSPSGMMTAAHTTGPASGPRPTSSAPAMYSAPDFLSFLHSFLLYLLGSKLPNTFRLFASCNADQRYLARYPCRAFKTLLLWHALADSPRTAPHIGSGHTAKTVLRACLPDVLRERLGALQGNAPEPPLAEIVYDRLRAPLVVVLAAL